MTSAELTASDPPLPRPFGPYTLFDRVGRGGMAEIFLARERGELGAARLVVVKQMLPELASSPDFAAMLIAEAKLAARLRHGNVAQVFDLGRHDGLLFIAMEYVEGLDLGDLLRRCTRQHLALPAEFGLHIVTEMLRGLEHAHRCPGDDGEPIGLVHRDVSLSNVLVSFEGEVKLCDFGIAHANESGAAPTGAIQGKAGYMAPEQARGEPLDARADVFAAGIVLWELLAGRRYYRASEGQSLLEIARQASFKPLPASDLPHHDQLALIVARALDSDRTARYPSAQAMRRDLEGYATRAGLVSSSLRLGAWVREHFADATVERRHRRERVLQALDLGPALVMTPIAAAVAEKQPESLAHREPPASLDVAPVATSVAAPATVAGGGQRWVRVAAMTALLVLVALMAYRLR